MNAAHLHLIVNHLPIVGIPLAAILVAWGLFRKSRDVLRASLGLAIAMAAATYPVFLTGEPAEEAIDNTTWVDEVAVERHEERAESALIVVLLTGALAAVALWQLRGNREITIVMPVFVLSALLASAGFLAWTALEGGKIRHTEIRVETTSNVRSLGDDAGLDHDLEEDKQRIH